MKELEEMRKAFDNLTNSALQLNEMYKKKCKIIEKAIDFIKENASYDEDAKYFCDDLNYDDCGKLLEILKGKIKNEN